MAIFYYGHAGVVACCMKYSMGCLGRGRKGLFAVGFKSRHPTTQPCGMSTQFQTSSWIKKIPGSLLHNHPSKNWTNTLPALGGSKVDAGDVAADTVGAKAPLEAIAAKTHVTNISSFHTHLTIASELKLVLSGTRCAR